MRNRGPHRNKIPKSVKVAVLARQESVASVEGDLVYCGHCLHEGFVTLHRGQPRLSPGFEWDHVVPVAAGGTNAAENIVVACRECNAAKGAKLHWVGPIDRWRAEQDRIEVTV